MPEYILLLISHTPVRFVIYPMLIFANSIAESRSSIYPSTLSILDNPVYYIPYQCALLCIFWKLHSAL